MNRVILSLSLVFIFFFTSEINAKEKDVSVKVFNQVFPTYNMGPDDPNPFFKDFAVEGLKFFRGSRSVYPYTFVNDYRQGKKDVEYEVVRLENDLIYVDIIPQLRGRIQGAVDKRNNWDFLYYNHVIKPAEIAVRSFWISGGLEYNHPGGHGYSQYSKISYDIIERKDGSKTIVVAEIEPIRMMKWEYEITLRPGELFVETKGRFMSTVPYRVPFVSSNNAAMHATDKMELIYPQATHASGHGFGGLKLWSEFSPDGSDWNWIKNIKKALSAFADGSGLLQDYWGTYSHDSGIDAGTVVIADHRVAPGKKFFSWGTHPSGKQWDGFLSDSDGGYVELQQQAYFSNLGYGYAILDPFEVKEFSIYWYPIKNTGGFVTASKEMAVNFKRLDKDEVKLDIQPTMNIPDAKILVYKNDRLAVELDINMEVGEVYNKKLKLQSTEEDLLSIEIVDGKKEVLISYANKTEPVNRVVNRIPTKKLSEYTIDQLYSKAITNYHDSYGVDANMYIDQILKRDPDESRANRLLGIISVKRGQYKKAIEFINRSLINDHFEQSYKSHFLLGYSYIQLGKLDKAHEHLVQSSRNKAELDNSLYYLAQIEVLKKKYHEALRILRQVPLSKLTHPNVYNLLSYTYRMLDDKEMATKYLKKSFAIDPLNFVGYIEKFQLQEEKEEMTEKINFILDRSDKLFIGSQNYIESAIFYMNLGDYDAAIQVLDIAEENYKNESKTYPILHYYKGYCLIQTGKKDKALEYYKMASLTDPTYVFPYRTESLEVLKNVIGEYPNDAIAKMYYGDLLFYLRRHEEAVAVWEEANRLDPENYQVNRNLAIGKYAKSKNYGAAIDLLERAFAQSNKNLRIYNELEQLYVLQKDFDKLEKHYDNNLEILKQKGDFAQNAADFYIQRNRFEDAQKVLATTYFSAAEKALGKPVRHVRYAEAYIGAGEKLLEQKKYKEAIEKLEKAYEYPEYLNEAEVNHPVTTRTDYFLALAYKYNKQKSRANEYFQKAIEQNINPVSVASIYKAKSLHETGKPKEAEKIVTELLQNLLKQNKQESAINDYLKSLAYEFLGEQEKAEKAKLKALDKNYNVVMEAMYESSFIDQKKFALE
jgi:tetratricopeptide (TPR) repeat protein